MSFTKTDASELLGMPEREITAVQEAKAGTIIQTFDGNAYIVVDGLDGNGNTGLMYLVPPHPRYDPAHSPMKVYAPPRGSAAGLAADQPELTVEQIWRNQQLAQIADGLDVELETSAPPADPEDAATTDALVDGPVAVDDTDDEAPAKKAPAKKAPAKKAAPKAKS